MGEPVDKCFPSSQRPRLRSRTRVTPEAEPGSSKNAESEAGRVSRARKSLNFDSKPATSTPIFNPSFPIGDGKSNTLYTVEDVRVNDAFWSNPPPPPVPYEVLPLFTRPATGSAVTYRHSQHRRSPRLSQKAAIAPPAKAKAWSASVVSDDSGFEPTPPSSQTFAEADLDLTVKLGASKSATADSASVGSSDYGTFSEDSFRIAVQSHSRFKRKCHRPACRRRARNTVQLQHENLFGLSPGYVSDIDVPKPLLSRQAFDDCVPQLWDEDDDEVTVTQTPDVTFVYDESEQLEGILVEEPGGASGVNSSYLDISNLSSKDVGVKWIYENGIHVIIPLEAVQVPSEPAVDLRSTLVIPNHRRRPHINNPSSPSTPPFMITTQKEPLLEETFLKYGLRLIGASATVSLHPQGTKFCQLYPAVVSIPLTHLPAAGDLVYCLEAQDLHGFDLGVDPCRIWTIMDSNRITLEPEAGRVTFETYEFANYAIVIREQVVIEAQKQIRTRIGGKLIVPEVPWIKIDFPRGSLREDVGAKATVFLDTELAVPAFFEERKRLSSFNCCESHVLASPIVMLEPHDYTYLPDPVRVDLPIPYYDDIMERNGAHAQLQVWQSCTGRDEPTRWERLNVPISFRRVKHLGNQTQTVASFTVSHFSFFKAVWDLISAGMYEARVGMSYFHSFVSFSMRCQANMEEAETTEEGQGSRFGLEITCFRSDKAAPGHTNYQYKVGSSSKPKLVRPGRIFVRLKSSYFGADLDAGEDPDLLKEEVDFRGRDFEVQYCCKFLPDKPIARGPFGKVIVNREKGGKAGEKLFEFNLQKSGHENEATPGQNEDRWSIVALQELASGLDIMEEENWKVFAQHVGFTKQEIKLNFKRAANPFAAIVSSYQHRGGTPDEFVRALYIVSRELRIPNTASSPSSSRQSRSSNTSSGRGSLSLDKYKGVSIGSDSDTSGTHISQDSALSGQSRKRSNPSIGRGGPSKPKRLRYLSPPPGFDGDNEGSGSDNGSTPETDEDVERTRGPCIVATAKSETNASSINRANDATKLETSFLWCVAALLERNTNWKSLGRSLWLDESILINIETNNRGTGMKELFYQVMISWREMQPKRCTFGVLYAALKKEKLNQAAKGMINIERNH